MERSGFKFTKIFSGFLSILLIVALIAAIFFRQDVYDWWRLRSYSPPSEIVALAKKTTMTEQGKKTFYVAHPSVTDAETFNQNCHISEFSIILGCYITGGNIYIYDVTDKRLSGIHEVTAAHEMLHVAYERLSAEERSNLNQLLDKAYQDVNDARIRSTIEQYRQNDASSVPNELHSILGTEVSDLPSALENHYAKYFSNRQSVVKLSQRYEREFSNRQNRVTEIDRALTQLKLTIDANQSELSAMNATLTSQRQELDALRVGDDTAAYNARVSSYNQLVDSYNSLVERTKSDIARYNNLVSERNSLVVEVQDLVEAIDSTPETIK